MLVNSTMLCNLQIFIHFSLSPSKTEHYSKNCGNSRAVVAAFSQQSIGRDLSKQAQTPTIAQIYSRVESKTVQQPVRIYRVYSSYKASHIKQQNLPGHSPSVCSTEWYPRTIAARCPCCAPPTRQRCTAPSTRSDLRRSSPVNLRA